VTYLDLPVSRFLDLLAGAEPAPSGGGAAALSVSLGAALCVMSARLGTRQLPAEETGPLIEDLSRIVTAAAALIQSDADSYQEVIAARRRAAGPGPVAAALSAAADVPMEIVELAVPVTRAAARLAEAGHPNLRGDAIAGALLAEAGARAAAVLVGINLAGMPDDARPAKAARLVEEARSLTAAAQRAAQPPS
jgi:methenyltetrahydrofolate cyclohydrolase